MQTQGSFIDHAQDSPAPSFIRDVGGKLAWMAACAAMTTKVSTDLIR